MGEIFCRLGVAKRILNQAEDFFPARFFASSGPAIDGNNQRGKIKGKNDMNTLIPQLRKVTPICLIACALGCLAPQTKAVVPPPDGGYLLFNTAEGQNALFSLT